MWAYYIECPKCYFMIVRRLYHVYKYDSYIKLSTDLHDAQPILKLSSVDIWLIWQHWQYELNTQYNLPTRNMATIPTTICTLHYFFESFYTNVSSLVYYRNLWMALMDKTRWPRHSTCTHDAATRSAQRKPIDLWLFRKSEKFD